MTKILLVDDSRTTREVLKVYLMGSTYEFIEADGAVRALRLLHLMSIDLVILDVNMPKVDGIELVRQIRADQKPAVSRVPIILVTADRSEDVAVRSSDANADAFLYKPIEPEQLVETVERLLREKRT